MSSVTCVPADTLGSATLVSSVTRVPAALGSATLVSTVTRVPATPYIQKAGDPRDQSLPIFLDFPPKYWLKPKTFYVFTVF